MGKTLSSSLVKESKRIGNQRKNNINQVEKSFEMSELHSQILAEEELNQIFNKSGPIPSQTFKFSCK